MSVRGGTSAIALEKVIGGKFGLNFLRYGSDSQDIAVQTFDVVGLWRAPSTRHCLPTTRAEAQLDAVGSRKP